MNAEFEFNDEQWQKVLKKLTAKIEITKNPSSDEARTFEAIASAVVFKDIVEHFDKETGPDGSWKAWSQAYESHLSRIGRAGNKKLQFSGRLRQGIVPSSRGEASPRKWKPEGLLFYNNVEYAAAHDEGLGKMPKRQFMWLSSTGLQNLVNQTLKWLAE